MLATGYALEHDEKLAVDVGVDPVVFTGLPAHDALDFAVVDPHMSERGLDIGDPQLIALTIRALVRCD